MPTRRGRAALVVDQLGAHAQPDPFGRPHRRCGTGGRVAGARGGDALDDVGEIAILRMQPRRPPRRRRGDARSDPQAEHFEHGVGPMDAPAREVPVPKTAATAAERRVDAAAHGGMGALGAGGAARLSAQREPRHCGDGGRGRRDRSAAQRGGAPIGQHGVVRMDQRDLSAAGAEIAHGGERAVAVGEHDGHHAGLLGEFGQQLIGAEQIGERAAGRQRRRRRDDASAGVGDGDAAPARGRVIGQSGRGAGARGSRSCEPPGRKSRDRRSRRPASSHKRSARAGRAGRRARGAASGGDRQRGAAPADRAPRRRAEGAGLLRVRRKSSPRPRANAPF